MMRMSMTAREPFAVWSSVRTAGIVGAFVSGALALRSWQRTQRTIQLARDSGDQMEVVARLRVAIRQAG
jgi:hypothetical protein